LTEWAYLEVRAGDADATLAALEESRRLLKKLLANAPTEVRYRLLFGKTVKRLGDWYFDLKEDYKQSRPYYEEALATMGSLANDQPKDHDIQFEYADAWSRLADQCAAEGDHEKALAGFEEELAVTVKLERDASDNVQTLWDSSISYDHVSREALALKRYD